MKKIAMVTGGNRGIGLECCRHLSKLGMKVCLTARQLESGMQAVELLKKEGCEDLHFLALDVTQEDSIQNFREQWEATLGRKIDVLINNAGVLLDPGVVGELTPQNSVWNASIETFRKTFEVNVYGVLRICQEFIPMMIENRYGRVVNVSSGMGLLHRMGGHFPAYRVSKTALNALTGILNAEIDENLDVLVNAASPGWVQTKMGGPHASRTPEEGVQTLIQLATLPTGGARGRFFRNGEEVAW